VFLCAIVTLIVSDLNSFAYSEISATNGRSLTAGVTWVYDIQIARTSGTANTATLLTGNITVTEDVTE
jgi:hypothetical protein